MEKFFRNEQIPKGEEAIVEVSHQPPDRPMYELDPSNEQIVAITVVSAAVWWGAKKLINKSLDFASRNVRTKTDDSSNV